MAKKKVELPFEDALKTLEETVKRLESEQIPLEESLALFEKGVALARTCSQTLDKAEQRVLELSKENAQAAPSV